MLKTRIFYSILFALLISALTFNIDIAFSQETPVIYVDPSTITGLAPSQTFTIEVKVANITDFYGADIQFKWDPLILEYVSHTAKIPVEDYPDGILHEPGITIMNTVDPVAGTYSLAYACLDPAPVFDGTGIAFNMTFTVIDIGQCLLEIYGSQLSDKGGTPIVHDVQNGHFNNYVPTEAKISVSPQSIINSALVPCTNFTININLENFVDLSSFEFWLGYDTLVLDTVEVNVDPAFQPPVEIQIVEPDGQVHVTANTLTPITGSLTIASITFHVTDQGESVIDLHNITLTDSWSEPIPYEEPVDGYFNNILVAKLYVYPPEIIDPTLTPGSDFQIDIKMQNIFNFYSYEFGLAYDSNVITCLGAVIHPTDNDTNFNTQIIINDASGNIVVNVTYHPPATPKSITAPTTIVSIYFQAKNYGSTALDLHDTKIVKQSAEEIPHEVEDGFFATLIRDVAIIHVEPSRNVTYPERIINITVVAANLGDIEETFNVTAYYDENKIGTQIVIDLPANQNITLVFPWNTSGLQPCTNYTIKAEATQVPYEQNITNNIYIDGYVKIKMIGDVNGDGKIDIYDITAAAGVYGSKEGDPNWNPDVDVAPQWGIINIYDLVTIASRYGQTCP